MPIRLENRARYPKDWKQISLRIRLERAESQCECSGQCGQECCTPRCQAMNYEPHPDTGSKVVLTVAHLDHIPENCGDDNLLAMCQRCHNRYDMRELSPCVRFAYLWYRGGWNHINSLGGLASPHRLGSR